MKKILGIELGSTRIKSVLIDENAKVIAQGGYEWENILVDGLWSYSLDEVEKGLRASYTALIKELGEPLKTVDAIGISGMMHGYLAFDENDALLAPFRTWRNTNTAEAAAELSELFGFNVPMRWSVSQYYQSVLDGLEHVKNVKFLTTLAGYVHYRLTGKKVLGINDASGMFPVRDNDYDGEMLCSFNSRLREKGLDISFKDLLPKVLVAGENAGCLTAEGAAWLDESGNLSSGILLCPPEGDMGTGMIATNCVSCGRGNVSSGTSANLTVILKEPLKNYYKEIDVIATPDGYPAALIHTNNCTTEINEWVSLIGEAVGLFGVQVSKGELFDKLFKHSLESKTGAGVVSYNFLAGEPLAGTEKGAPMVVRSQDGEMSLAAFMQSQIYSAVAALALGMDILKREGVSIDSVLAHGGFYKTDFVGQNATSAILETPVTVMQNASEGGAWGMAILALYATDNGKSLGDFLDGIFADVGKTVVMADEEELTKCREYMKAYRKYLAAEKTAADGAV
ncbi:MAG: ATPase [Ruminococcaceae bacterium]|nr:ATPase [Oscillospiraceae bacterium]